MLEYVIYHKYFNDGTLFYFIPTNISGNTMCGMYICTHMYTKRVRECFPMPQPIKVGKYLSIEDDLERAQ